MIRVATLNKKVSETRAHDLLNKVLCMHSAFKALLRILIAYKYRKIPYKGVDVSLNAIFNILT